MTTRRSGDAFSIQRFLERWGVVVAFVLLFAAGTRASTS
jgi:hypothetical protein